MIHYYELCFYGDEDPECTAYDANRARSYCIKTEIPPVIDPEIALNILFHKYDRSDENELRQHLTCIMEVTEDEAAFFDCDHLTKRITDKNGTYYTRDDDMRQSLILQTKDGKLSRRFEASINSISNQDIRNFGADIKPASLQSICDDMNCFSILNRLPFRWMADFEQNSIYKYPVETTAHPVDRLQIWDLILKMLPDKPNTYWTNGDEILCDDEVNTEVISKALTAIIGDNLVTGWYDPEEDARNQDIDEFTGYNYIRLG